MIDLSIAAAELIAIVLVDARQLRVERAVEVEGVDPVDAMQLDTPLHRASRKIPLPPPGMRESFTLAVSCFRLSQHRLGEALLRDVLHHRD